MLLSAIISDFLLFSRDEPHISESKTLITNLASSQKEIQVALRSMQRTHLLSLLRNCARLLRSSIERFPTSLAFTLRLASVLVTPKYTLFAQLTTPVLK